MNWGELDALVFHAFLFYDNPGYYLVSTIKEMCKCKDNQFKENISVVVPDVYTNYIRENKKAMSLLTKRAQENFKWSNPANRLSRAIYRAIHGKEVEKPDDEE
jgi:hypothetical protein